MSTPGFRLSRGSTWGLRALVVIVLAFIFDAVLLTIQYLSTPWRRARPS